MQDQVYSKARSYYLYINIINPTMTGQRSMTPSRITREVLALLTRHADPQIQAGGGSDIAFPRLVGRVRSVLFSDWLLTYTVQLLGSLTSESQLFQR